MSVQGIKAVMAAAELFESTPRTRGADGMVYRGDCDLIHVEDGKRAEVGAALAEKLGEWMRREAQRRGEDVQDKALCPGCYMVVIFNCAVTLAQRNGQSVREMARTLSNAFDQLAIGGPAVIEAVSVLLDTDD